MWNVWARDQNAERTCNVKRDKNRSAEFKKLINRVVLSPKSLKS